MNFIWPPFPRRDTKSMSLSVADTSVKMNLVHMLILRGVTKVFGSADDCTMRTWFALVFSRRSAG